MTSTLAGVRPTDDQVVRTGRILHDGRIACPCRIVRTRMRPLHLDRAMGHWFRVDFTAAGEPTHWSSAIEGFETIDEAIAYLVEMGVEWDAA